MSEPGPKVRARSAPDRESRTGSSYARFVRRAQQRALSILLSALAGCGARVVYVGDHAPTARDHARRALFRDVVEATESAVPGAVVTGVRILPLPAHGAAEVTLRNEARLDTIVVDLEAMTPIPSSRAASLPEVGETIPSGSLAEVLEFRVLDAETETVRVTDLAGRSVTVVTTVVDGRRHEHWDLGMGCLGEMLMVSEALARRDRERAAAAQETTSSP